MAPSVRHNSNAPTSPSPGFLEELYLDSFNQARFEEAAFPSMEPQAQRIISDYRELIKGHSPAKLEKEGAIPPELMEGLKKIGLFGLNIPSEYGGQGLSLIGYLGVLRAVARTDMALALTPTAHLSIGLKGIILFGTEEQKKKYLTQAATGEMIFAYALTEPAIGSDAQHIQTTAILSDDGQHYILNGQKTYITNGGFSGGLTVFAQMDPEKPGFMGAFIVETAWDGVKIGNEIPKMGLKISSTTPITFENVKVPVQNLLGDPGDGFRIAMTILNYGRLGLGAASVGAMEQSLEDMFKRATTRKQFGVSIREFDLIQEKMVHAAGHGLAAEAMTALTASLLERDPAGSMAIESSHVKLYGTTRAWDTLYEALQTAGGSGYLATQPYEKRMRDFRVTTVFEGTSEIHTMYPALYLLRVLGKRLKGKNRMAQAVYLIREAYRGPGLSLDYREPAMARAASLAATLVRRVRRMIHLGVFRHGKGLVNRQYFLRRITHMSLAAYQLLATLAWISNEQKEGREVTAKLNLLTWLTEEAVVTLRTAGFRDDDPVETAGRIVFADIVAANEATNQATDQATDQGSTSNE